MKTKHLFFTMALAGVFAACTNDDFLEVNAPQNSTTGQERPTISNVTLTVDEPATRLSYSGRFSFEKGDVISALLMDENNTGIRYGITTNTDEWNKLTWLEKYHLVDYVHTNFPFAYDGTDFSSNCNMLEGNYFLVYPYTCLDGNRQARIDISKQVQKGGFTEADQAGRIEFLEENQRFIGYAQLKAGEGVSDFKANLVPILSPLRIALKSQGNVGKDYHVTKLVVSHPSLTGTLNIDPTRAYYNDPTTSPKAAGWNLETDYVKDHTDSWVTANPGDIYHFNYANFLGNQTSTMGEAAWDEELYYNERYGSMKDIDYVYNVKGEAGDISKTRLERNKEANSHVYKYYWDDAIRAAVQPMREFNNTEYATQYVEVYLEQNGEKYATLKSNSTLETIIMLPAFDLKGSEEDVMLTVYTQEGIIKNINLSKQYTGQHTDLQTSGIFDNIDPTDKVVQRVEVIIDNPDVVQYPTDVVINNEDDLLQWTKWLNESRQNTGNKNPIATFTNDITINDELAAEIMKLKENYILTIKSDAVDGNNLRIATANYPNVLEVLDVWSDVTVEVMGGGVLNMTDKSYNIEHEISAPTNPEQGQLHIEVAEGGKLNIVNNDRESIQGGFESSGTPVPARTEVLIENKGTVDVTASSVIGIYIVNEGVMNVAKDSKFYFAPKSSSESEKRSLNTIKGTINVDGEIGGTINGFFINRGVINNGSKDNAGRLLNIINLSNDKEKKPGLIVIQNIGSFTGLTENTGVVDYQNYLTGVEFDNLMGGYEEAGKDGTYKYTGAGVGTKALSEAYVTDAVITSGEVVTDQVGTTLRNLTLDGATVIYDGEGTPNKNQVLQFVESKGTLTLKGASTVNNVIFTNLAGNKYEKKVDVLIAADATVTFTGDLVQFWNKYEADQKEFAGIHFKKANLEVKKDCQVIAKGLYSVEQTKSAITNYGEMLLAKLNYLNMDYQFTFSQNKPILVEGGETLTQTVVVIKAVFDNLKNDPTAMTNTEDEFIKAINEYLKNNTSITETGTYATFYRALQDFQQALHGMDEAQLKDHYQTPITSDMLREVENVSGYLFEFKED